jgi:hypothetical protein
MGKYRKKPVVIEAVQFDGTEQSLIEICSFATGKAISSEYGGKAIRIPTLEGQMIADIGDFIIKGVQGEFYPCKPDIFELTYEEVYEVGDE